MKILFVLRTQGNFPYHQTTIDHLLRRGHEVTLLFEPRAHQSAPDDHGLQEWLAREARPLLTVGQALTRGGAWRRVLFATREMRSYAHYCRRGAGASFYRDRWREHLPAPAKRFATHAIGAYVFRMPAMELLMAGVEHAAPASPEIVAALAKERPDRVVASPVNLWIDEEVEYVKAAHALGIPSVVPVLSWDNLTTKGLLHVHPHLLLAWHAGHAEEAQTVHGMAPNRIVITGSPFFDRWFESGRRVDSRADICRRIGVDPDVPYVLYLGSSSNIARDESWVVVDLLHALRASSDPTLRGMQILFKPHPANLRAIPRLDEHGIAVWPRERGRPDTPDDVQAFRQVMDCAIAAVGINTTGMLDAVICNRPCIALEVKRYGHTQSRTPHFQRMKESGALSVTGSAEGAVKILGRLVSGVDRKVAARNQFVRRYVRPRGFGAQAGEAAAMAIELASTAPDAARIGEAIDRALGVREAR